MHQELGETYCDSQHIIYLDAVPSKTHSWANSEGLLVALPMITSDGFEFAGEMAGHPVSIEKTYEGAHDFELSLCQAVSDAAPYQVGEQEAESRKAR